MMSQTCLIHATLIVSIARIISRPEEVGMRAHRLSSVLALVLLACGLTACGTGSGGSSSSGLQIWEGYTGAEANAFKHLVAEWNKAHPSEKVTSFFVNNDNSLPKLLTAVKGGSQPDIAYVYGSWAPN